MPEIKSKSKTAKSKRPTARKPLAKAAAKAAKSAHKPARAASRQQATANTKAKSKARAKPKPRAKSNPGRVVPALRYRDAAAAIEFLCNAFGFEKHMVVPGADDIVEHAQLTLGDAMIMLGTVRDNEFGRLMKQPDEIGNAVTQSPYVVIDDIDAHYERARDAGAEIVMAIADQDYGGRLYVARDPEGHVWNFGSYDPWAAGDDDET